MPHIWPPFVTRRIDIVLFFFLLPWNLRRNDLHPICGRAGNHLFSAGLKIFLLLLLARTYGCTLLGENLFSSATCARRHVFFILPSGFVLFQHTLLAGWLAVRQMETINSSRFYCRRAAPRYGEIAGTVYDPFLLRFFFLSLWTMTGICL